jgi:hypothetical protein
LCWSRDTGKYEEGEKMEKRDRRKEEEKRNEKKDKGWRKLKKMVEGEADR